MKQKLTKERTDDLKIIVMLTKLATGVEPKLCRMEEFKIVDACREQLLN